MPSPFPARYARRDALAMLAAAAGAALAPRTPAIAAAECVETPEILQGPFFVDEPLRRAAIDEGLHGVPLSLTLDVRSLERAACVALPGAHVDVWHADPVGRYSDAATQGTAGRRFLRGYQLTGAHGSVTFRTIFPGWYDHRVAHVHVKVRAYDRAGRATHLLATQLYFDDAVSDAVFATPAYASRGRAQVTTARDELFDRRTLVRLERSGAGYAGTITLAVRPRA